jgi:hypothetical protein
VPSVTSTDRRRLGTWLIGGIASAISGTAAAIFGRFVGGSASVQEPGEIAPLSLGRVSDWVSDPGPVEKTASFVERDGYLRENRRTRIFLARIGLEPVVFSATCTHLAIEVRNGEVFIHPRELA